MNSISWFVYTVHGNKNMAIQKSNLFNEYLLLFMRRPVLIFWVLTMCTAGLSAFHVFVSFSQTTLGVRYWFFFQFAYVQTELRVSEWFARGLYPVRSSAQNQNLDRPSPGSELFNTTPFASPLLTENRTGDVKASRVNGPRRGVGGGMRLIPEEAGEVANMHHGP